MPSDKKMKDKKKLASKLGTGGARKAADAMINRQQVLDDLIYGSSGKKKGK